MKTALLDEGVLKFQDTALPEPAAGQALVHLSAAGVCHSDLNIVRGDWGSALPSSTSLGHEGIGTVEAVGAGVTSIKIGDRVIVGLGGAGGDYWCGACEQCLSGKTRNCADARPVLGTFSEYIAVGAAGLVTLPDSISDEEAPLACGGLTAYSAIRKLVKNNVTPGRPIAIIGAAGGLGHYAVQIAKAFGYRVVGIDVGEEKLEFIRSLGADFAVGPAEAADLITREFGGRGVDASVVFAARLSAFDLGLDVLKRGGLFIAVGIPPQSDGKLQLDPWTLFRKDPTIMYSAVGNIVEMRDLVELAAAGKVRSHISRHAKLTELNSVFDDLDAGRFVGRAVITDLTC